MSRFQIFLYRLLIYTANHFSSTLPLQYWAIQPWKMSGKWKAKMKMKLLKRLYIPYAVFKAPPFCLPEMLGKCKMFFVPTTKGMGCFPASLLCMLIAGPTAEAATSCWTVSGAACFITSSWLKISLKDLLLKISLRLKEQGLVLTQHWVNLFAKDHNILWMKKYLVTLSMGRMFVFPW